jgi:hypothetical protein
VLPERLLTAQAATGIKPMSKHDSATKRKRRPKSDKRVDYTASTMAAVKKLEQAAKARESQSAQPKSA